MCGSFKEKLGLHFWILSFHRHSREMLRRQIYESEVQEGDLSWRYKFGSHQHVDMELEEVTKCMSVENRNGQKNKPWSL